MNCQEYRNIIEDTLDASLHGEPEHKVRLHLEHCASCRDYFKSRRDEHIALFSGINAACAGLRLPDGFADRLVASVRARQAARRGWRRLSLPRWALIAASLVVVAGFVFANVKLIMENVELAGGGEAVESEGTNATESTEARAVEVAEGAAIVPNVPSVPCVSSVSSTPSIESNQEGEKMMIKTKAAVAALTAAFATAPLAAANGDEYQFIISGYPAENPSYSEKSEEVALETGALRVMGDAGMLEARSRTRSSSTVIALDASKWTPGLIFIYK